MGSERNQLCPCGSGKKHKRCFGADDPSCTLLQEKNRKELIEEHADREKEVFDFFKSVMEESNQVFLNEENGINRIPIRIQMIVAFSTIDMLGSYWFEYLGKTGKTNERAQEWYETFAMTEENKYFVGLIRDVTSERLYKLRNSLVHFWGLSEAEKSIIVSLAANDMSDEYKSQLETTFEKNGHKTILLRPKDFYDLVREGALLMLENWGSVIQEAQTNQDKEKEYISGIERVYLKTRKEGAKSVPRGHVEDKPRISHNS